MPSARPWPPPLPSTGPRAAVGVFGGSGFYRFTDRTSSPPEELHVDTDHHAGVDHAEAVAMERVFAVLDANVEDIRSLLFRLIPAIVTVMP